MIADIALLPGMDAATEGAMRALGLHLTSDLLRTNRPALVAEVPGLTLARLRDWQSFSRLLEVEGATPEIAGALLAGGVNSLSELTSRSLAQMRILLGGIAPPVDDDAILALLLDARWLEHTGVINGTVVTSNGLRLEGTTATAGGQTATSDARGRFRLLRLRLDTPVTLTLNHPTKAERSIERVAVAPSSALAGRTFKLTGRPAVPRRLSALVGDKLPPLGSGVITTEAQAGAPSMDDLLAVIDFYANGDARASSLFLDFTEGRFVVRTYRLAVASLPDGTVTDDRLQLTTAGLVKTSASARKVAREVRLRALAAELKRKPVAAAAVDAAAARILATLSHR